MRKPVKLCVIDFLVLTVSRGVEMVCCLFVIRRLNINFTKCVTHCLLTITISVSVKLFLMVSSQFEFLLFLLNRLQLTDSL